MSTVNPDKHDHKKQQRLAAFATAVLVIVGSMVLVNIVRRNRDLRQRLVCGTRIKTVGTAVKIYAGTPELECGEAIKFLVAQGELKPENTICPASGKPFLFAPIPAAKLMGLSPRDVVAYEPLSYHKGHGGNILYGDGHASFAKPDRYQEAIAHLQASGNWDVSSNGPR
ncbi:MAG: hypothetical protein DHS20C16_16490 [Phycisphaerae bacterium]|nr:MAG: hypothetical protein DHS20C16_16490 [Phycisphaerae bacterium]